LINMPNASWVFVQNLWTNGLGALFGTDLMLIGVFFLLFVAFVAVRMGLSAEIALPFGGAMLFVLTIMNPSLLPGGAYTVFLFLGAIIVFIALKRILGGF